MMIVPEDRSSVIIIILNNRVRCGIQTSSAVKLRTSSPSRDTKLSIDYYESPNRNARSHREEINPKTSGPHVISRSNGCMCQRTEWGVCLVGHEVTFSIRPHIQLVISSLFSNLGSKDATDFLLPFPKFFQKLRILRKKLLELLSFCLFNFATVDSSELLEQTLNEGFQLSYPLQGYS